MKIDLENYSNFGNLLQKLCSQKGVKSRDVCNSIKISPSYMCELQKGIRKPPKEDILIEMFKYFEIDEIQQEELLYLIKIERYELTEDVSKFLNQNKNAAKLIKQITKIKNFDEIAKNNPDVYERLQNAIDELTIISMEEITC